MADTLPGWPRYLSRAQAAAYVGVSADTFDSEVASGQWPPARRRGAKGTRATWDRLLIDAFADRDSGLGQTVAAGHAAPAAEAAALAAEAAAMKGVRDLAPPRNRPQHQNPRAA